MFGVDQLHPLFVHFPVAFLALAAGTALWWLLTGALLARQTTTLLLAAGCLGAFAAHFTGEDMAQAFASRPAVKLLGDRHEDFGLYTLLAAVVGTAAFVAAGIAQASADRKGLPGPDREILLRLLCVLFALATGALVIYTGHMGALMTWGKF